MPAKKSPAKKPAAPVAPSTWDGPFYNPHSCLIRDTYEIPVSEIPILPEYISACLSNLAAFEHQSDDNAIVPGAAEWCQQYLSRVLREEPQAMLDAMKMQVGSKGEQLEQEAMHVARRMAVITSEADGEKVSFMPVKELFQALEKCHPELYDHIPRSKKGRADWLTRAKLKFLPQKRKGSKISPAQIALVKMIQDKHYPTEKPMAVRKPASN